MLAAGRRVAEAGTAFGEGAEAMARTAKSVVTVELDPDRAAQAARRLASYENLELLVGDWRELLPPRGPFELLFLDAGGFKHEPVGSSDLVFGLLPRGGLLVMDDMTPNWPEFDPGARLGTQPPRAQGNGGVDDPRELGDAHRQI